MMSHTVI